MQGAILQALINIIGIIHFEKTQNTIRLKTAQKPEIQICGCF
jgi:hypothetical protein